LIGGGDLPEREDGLPMPSTPFDGAHPDNLRAMIGELRPQAGTPPIAEAGDGKAEAMLRAITETGLARSAGEDVTGEAAGAAPSPVRVVPAGMWRPKAIAAALRQEGEAPPKEIEAITALLFGFHIWRELVRAATKGKADPPDEQCDAEEVRRRAHQADMLASCTDMGPMAAAIAVDALQPITKAGRPALDPDTVARMRAAAREHVDAHRGDDLGSKCGDDLDDCEAMEADGTAEDVAGLV